MDANTSSVVKLYKKDKTKAADNFGNIIIIKRNFNYSITAKKHAQQDKSQQHWYANSVRKLIQQYT